MFSFFVSNVSDPSPFPSEYDLLDASPSLPLVIFIHGGAWVSERKSDHYELARSLHSLPARVALVEYRLASRDSSVPPDPAGFFPRHMYDVAAGVASLVRFHNASCSPVFLFGHSVGATMSALLYLDAKYLGHFGVDHRVLSGVISTEGIFSHALLMESFDTYWNWFYKYVFATKEDAESASPLCCVENMSGGSERRKWLLVHSEGDDLVDARQSRAFADALARLGDQVGVHLGMSGSHNGIINEVVHRQKVLPLIHAFISQ